MALKNFLSPTIPTKAEREEHESTHVQFRSWCKHCVCGRGMSSPHRDVSSSRKSHLHPTIAMDYCFPKDFDGNCPTCLVCTHEMGAKKAIVIPQKGGGNEWAVDQIVKTIDLYWGCKKVILKTDKEPAIVDFRKAVGEGKIEETLMESAPNGEKQSNLMAEKKVRCV